MARTAQGSEHTRGSPGLAGARPPVVLKQEPWDGAGGRRGVAGGVLRSSGWSSWRWDPLGGPSRGDFYSVSASGLRALDSAAASFLFTV